MFSHFNPSKLFLSRKKNSILLHSLVSFSSLVTSAASDADISAQSCLKEKSRADKSPNTKHYTVSYLINSCGLSPERAEHASKYVKFHTPERPDSVLKLLTNHGFDKTHVSRVIQKRPHLIMANPELTLLPKMEFLKSVGFSKIDIAEAISFNPTLLAMSVESQMASYAFLKNLLGSDEKVIALIKRSRWIFYSTNIVPNVTLLRQVSVPAAKIEFLLKNRPLYIRQNHGLFRIAVDRVKELGFDPSYTNFVQAVGILSSKGNKLVWARNFEAYKKWGWSEHEILEAFKNYPFCMILSEKKIERTMDFLVNKFGYPSKMIAKRPSILAFSLDKRIIPRCSVIQVLSSKGLITEMTLRSILLPVEKRFLERFVTGYEDQLPQLMSVYQGKMDILAL